MKVDLFDFDLPTGLIALRPARPRDSARMLVVRPGSDPELTDMGVGNLVDVLMPGDLLVLNDTRVIPARLRARRKRPGATGASIELLLHQSESTNTWTGFARPAKRIKPGDRLEFVPHEGTQKSELFAARVVATGTAGLVSIEFEIAGTELQAAISQHGEMPLPPYIAAIRPTDDNDTEDYQTIYARKDGAIAAPTAGLHLTDRLLRALDEKGVDHCFVTLHVGAGTFLPVKAEDTKDHRMHAETGEISSNTSQKINAARRAGHRIIAVGTTSLRLLETAVEENGDIGPFGGPTDIFITPGYKIRGCDLLLTNFHLPRSTLFMLVSTFCGLDVMQRAYRHAIARGYRFYSYGDACLLHLASDS